MKIKQDPVTKLWCREDGAVLLPPSGTKFKKFRWTFGTKQPDGYRKVGYLGKRYQVHRIICRAFHGLPPADKPEVDHLDRNPSNNAALNLHWTDSKGNNDNKASVAKSIERYGVRCCEDRKAYFKAYDAARIAKKKAQGLVKRKGPDGKRGWYPAKA